MNRLDYCDTTAIRHAPLVQRAEAVVLAAGGDGQTLVRDHADRSPLPPRAHLVSLQRGGTASIERDGPFRTALNYADPGSEAALAALLACIARPGAPIACDPESLSVLALA